MLHNHIIQPSVSPWSSPVVLHSQKERWHFPILYWLPPFKCHHSKMCLRYHVSMTCWNSWKIFTILDAKCKYRWIHPPEKRLPNGLYEFLVMRFGICNAPATFQQLIQQVLSGMGNDSPFCCACIDDILVHSNSGSFASSEEVPVCRTFSVIFRTHCIYGGDTPRPG